MRLAFGICVCAGVAAAFAQTLTQCKTVAASAGVFGYPAKGQTAGQQTKDDADCYNWAKQRSGYAPMSPPPVTTQAQATRT